MAVNIDGRAFAVVPRELFLAGVGPHPTDCRGALPTAGQQEDHGEEKQHPHTAKKLIFVNAHTQAAAGQCNVLRGMGSRRRPAMAVGSSTKPGGLDRAADARGASAAGVKGDHPPSADASPVATRRSMGGGSARRSIVGRR